MTYQFHSKIYKKSVYFCKILHKRRSQETHSWNIVKLLLMSLLKLSLFGVLFFILGVGGYMIKEAFILVLS